MREIRKRPKLIIVLFTILILFFIGVSYGFWSNILSISGTLTTGSFHIEFGNKEDIQLNLITLDSQDNITVHHTVNKANVTKNDNKNIVLALNDSIINMIKDSDYMLQIKYPIKTTDSSKIKAIQPRIADFNKPDESIILAPDSVRFMINGIDMDFPIEINEDNYVIQVNVYKQIEETNIASVFLDVEGINNSYDSIGTVEYDFLIGNFSMDDFLVSYDNPTIDVQLEAEYSLEVSIETEQFNNVKGVERYEK